MSRYGDASKYNSIREDYMTTPAIYQPLLDLFGRKMFDVDVCCTKDNIPANIRYTKNENGLLQPWSGLSFCNPPWKYTRYWVNKGYKESQDPKNEVCFVIPSGRFETDFMQKCIINNPHALWLILPGKQGFIIPGQESEPPVPSVGTAIAVLSYRAKELQYMLNFSNPYKTTVFSGDIPQGRE